MVTLAYLAQQHGLFLGLLQGHRHLCYWALGFLFVLVVCCCFFFFFNLCIVLGPNTQLLQDPDRSALCSLVPSTGICTKAKAATEACGHGSPLAETQAPAGTGARASGTEVARGKVTGREIPRTVAEMLLCRIPRSGLERWHRCPLGTAWAAPRGSHHCFGTSVRYAEALGRHRNTWGFRKRAQARLVYFSPEKHWTFL